MNGSVLKFHSQHLVAIVITLADWVLNRTHVLHMYTDCTFSTFRSGVYFCISVPSLQIRLQSDALRNKLNRNWQYQLFSAKEMKWKKSKLITSADHLPFSVIFGNILIQLSYTFMVQPSLRLLAGCACCQSSMPSELRKTHCDKRSAAVGDRGFVWLATFSPAAFTCIAIYVAHICSTYM